MSEFGPPEIAWIRLPDPSDPTGPGIPHPVLFRDRDGYAVFEGCILLGKTQTIRTNTKQINAQPQLLSGHATLGYATIAPTSRWPGNDGAYPVPFDSTLLDATLQAVVQQAIDHWHAHTKLRFIATARNALPENAPNIVVFRTGTFAGSYVGRQPGAQDIILPPGTTMGNVLHEIGHAAGLWHEHTRPDRDQKVKMILSNIQPAARFNFQTRTGDGMALGDYDFGSIMHYPPDAFAIDPALPTMVARNGEPIGQRLALSPGDIATIETLYP